MEAYAAAEVTGQDCLNGSAVLVVGLFTFKSSQREACALAGIIDHDCGVALTCF